MPNLRRNLMYAIPIIIMSIGFGLFGADKVAGQSPETVVHVEALDHAFDVEAPNELPSGWITIIFSNQMASFNHEISLVQLPDGVAHEDYLTDYMIAWETLLREYQEGVVERSGISGRVNEMLPAWSGDVHYVNGRGLVSPGRTAERTTYLKPGKYLLVCWMKTEDGIIHIMEGMHWEFTVTDEATNSPEPNPESRITLHEKEIEVDWEPEKGKHAFALELGLNPEGQSHHNNVHLVRMEDGTDLDKVNEWMDWYKIGGLRSPSPFEFLGGLGYVSEAETGYFGLNITEPGEYAWVVFVPRGKGLYKTFTID